MSKPLALALKDPKLNEQSKIQQYSIKKAVNVKYKH